MPGALGVLCLLGAGVGLSILPFQVGGLLLLVAGFITVGLEAYVGGKGLFALLGTGAVIVGGLLLFEVEGFDLRVDAAALFSVGLFVMVVAVAFGALMAKAQLRPVQTGAEGMVGLSALVTRGGLDKGWVRVQGEEWSATWSGELQPGAEVTVVRPRPRRALEVRDGADLRGVCVRRRVSGQGHPGHP